MSAYLQELCCHSGQAMVYEEASAFIEKYLMLSVAGKQIERVCHYYGEKIEERIAQQVREGEACQVEDKDSLHYVMVDGSMLLTREEKWKEMKVGRIFRVEDSVQLSTKRRWILRSKYVAHLGGHEAFEEKMERLVEGIPKKVFVSDGAPWIWDWVESVYPKSLQILDYYHAKEHLCDFANLYFKTPDQRKQWIDKQETLLLNDDVEEVIRNIIALPKTGKRVITAKQKAVARYCRKNQKRMRYKTYKAMGLMIGSGPIKAAHRHLIQQRMKRSGQRWTKKGLQQVANLRVVHKSNEWNTLIDMINRAA
jgi:predicted glutamine amidotransferase